MKTSLTNSSDLLKGEIEQLAQIFPQFVSEGKVDIGGLQSYIDQETITGERYNLNRYGKSQSKLIAREPSIATLIPNVEKSINFDTSKNLLIEGDNLEVLKLLQSSYQKEVKVIYIDPPYNKDKDFVYSDTRKDSLGNYMRITGQVDDAGETNTGSEKSGRKHSNWLSMMYPRLYLARKLLKDDGVIFVSIDDDEVHNLRKLMDEVFGEENFIGQLVGKSNPRGRAMDMYYATTKEYILVYAKDGFQADLLMKTIEDEKKLGSFVNIDTISKYKKGYPLHNGTRDFHINNRPNLAYSIYYHPKTYDAVCIDEKSKNESGYYIDDEKIDKQLIEQGYCRVIPSINEKTKQRRVWRRGKDKFMREYHSELLFTADEGYYFYQKERLTVDGEKFEKFKDLIENIPTDLGGKEIENLFGQKIFSFPKPTKILKELLKHTNTKNELILDFFAGSGTTGHAVMELNAEDKCNRRYILVQLPEQIKETEEAFKAGYRTISEITRGRLIKAGEKIGGEGDNGFKFLKLHTSNFQELDPITVSEATTTQAQLLDRIALEYDRSGLKQDRKELDIIYELLIRYGYSLHNQIVKDTPYPGRYTVRDDKISERSFFISLQDTLSDSTIQTFLKSHHEQKDTVFLCKDTAISDSHRITLAQYFSRFSTF